MSKDVAMLSEAIQREADELLDAHGLRALLERYGQLHVTGSYALRLMTWRDLDVYLEAEDISVTEFFVLGGGIASMLSPIRMSFRNERIAQSEGLPRGLYWGVYLGNEREGAWKIDIWAVSMAECRRLVEHCDNLAARLSPTARDRILEIKSECWRDPEYRRSYSSQDIYRAVLDEGAIDIDDFKEYLCHRSAQSGQ